VREGAGEREREREAPSAGGACPPAAFRLQPGRAKGRLGLRPRAGRVPRGQKGMVGRAGGAGFQLRRARLCRVGHRGDRRELPHPDWRDGPRRCSACLAIYVQHARLTHVLLLRLHGPPRQQGCGRHGPACAGRSCGAAGGAGRGVGLRQRGAARTGADGDGPAAAGALCTWPCLPACTARVCSCYAHMRTRPEAGAHADTRHCST
jgi:hypothetical protein